MKTVQILPELNEGGVERGTVELNREMVKRGIDSVVISAGGKLVEQIEADGGEHIVFDVCSKNVLTGPYRTYHMRKLMRQLNPDILHVRSRIPAWLVYLANRKIQLPLVTTVHGFNSVNPYSRVMTFGDQIICVSGAIKEYIQSHYQVPDEKITVIPRGVDLGLFNPEAVDCNFIHQFKREHNLEGKFVVSAVGRITQLKDYETFIRGIVGAKKQIPDICGLIVGGVRADKAAYAESLKTLVAKLGAKEFIHFAGSQNKIAEIYSLSNLVAICSEKPESFGRTAAEALAMNVPVIATNHGGVLDIIREGHSGAFFAVGDHASLSRQIVAFRGKIGTDLRSEIAREFSLKQMVDKTTAVYQRALAR